MCRWDHCDHGRKHLPKVIQQVAAHLPLYCSLNPSSSNSLHLSQQAFHVQDLSHLLCFANLGRMLHSLRYLKNPHSKVSANTVESNRVEKGQHGSLGSCPENPSFPREAFKGGGSDLGSGFHCAAEGRTLTERTKRRYLKRHAAQSGRVDQAGLFLPEKQRASVCALIGLPSYLPDRGQQPSWKGHGPALT